MKPVKIILVLTLTVVLLSVAVFFVEDITSSVIADRQAKEVEEALQTIFPSINGTTDTISYVNKGDSGVDFGVTGINQVIEITTDGNAKGYVYNVTFRGFASEITYLMGVDAAGTITGYQVLSQSDTPGYGGQIGDSVNWQQFTNMSIDAAGNGDFDGLSGATITTTAWKASLNQVFTYHLNTYGYTPKTDAQILQEKKESLVDSALTVEPYTATNPYEAYGVTGIDVATDGSTNKAVIYTVEFVGYNPNGTNKYIIAIDLDTNKVLGYMTIYSDDSTDYGQAKMLDTANWTQFIDQSATDLQTVNVDGFSGASITGGALEQSLQLLAIYHRWEFEGVQVLTKEQQFEAYKQELYPTATSFVDVTNTKPASSLISAIYDAYDDQDNFLGTVYHVTTIGASYSNITFIEFLVGIDKDNNYTGFRMFDDSETEGKADPFYVDGYGDTISGDSIDNPLGLDSVSGSTITYDAITTAIGDVVTYHKDKYFSRPDSVIVDNADLLAAYPSAASFVSVYENYTYNGSIGNIYQALDGSSNVLGYVYYAVSEGRNGPITFTIGISSTGVTEQIHVISDTETWGDAASGEYATYDGSWGTVFSTSSWFDLYEGKTLSEILSSPFDSTSGVSTTTNYMLETIKAIAQYHQDEAVGGAN